MSEHATQRLSDAAAIYRHEGRVDEALKLEAILSSLDANRPARVVDLEAAEALAAAVLAPTPPTEEPRDPPTWEELAGQFASQRDEARAELVKLKGARLLSVLFGHHDGAPRAFALQRKDTGHTLVALGAEFPDDAVALRLANDGGWTTKSEGGAAQFATDDVEILWLTDELDSLADMEQRAERAEAERDRLRSDLNQATAVVEAAKAWADSRPGSTLAAVERLIAAVDAYRAALLEE